MTFYSANHTGINDLTADEINNAIPNSRQPSGCLTRAELDLALTNKRCVGIRVYKTGSAARRQTNRELVVCGVLENGFDAPERKSGFFRRSKDTIFQIIERIAIAPEATSFQPESATVASRNRVQGHLSDDTPLLAFFSRQMLNRLLDDPEVTGILIYEANLEPIKTRVPNLSVPAPLSLASYMAFATKSTGDKVNLPSFTQSSIYVLSDLPCPGHCIQIDENGKVSTGDMVVILSRFEDNPYPKPWDNDDHTA